MEIEKPFPRSPLRKHMEFVIIDFPKDLGLKKERVKPGERYAFDQISDKLIVWDRSPNKNSYLKRGFGFLSIVLFFTLYFTPWNPPGSAFDPYRKKDYERRKAEGFPAPLYESKIPTPEYVPGSDSSIVDNLN